MSRVPKPDLSRRTALTLVLLLTLLGGVLRTVSLERPAIWGDEARTFARTFTTWQGMLGLLDEAGFMPGSYVGQWWIGQGMPVAFSTATTKPSTNPASPDFGLEPGEVYPTHRLAGGSIALSPRVIRIIPATCGILMIPAMYFLARRFVNRRLSVWAVAFTAISAYMLVYSRDAKMYMQLVFAATLHLACFFWWLRVTEGKWKNEPRTMLAWLAWVASGLLMISMQLIGLIVLGLQLIFLLSMPRVALWYVFPKDRGVWVWISRSCFPAIFGFAIGIALICWAPWAYYSTFNKFVDQVLPQDGSLNANVDSAGLGWVERYVEGREGPNLVMFNSTAYLTGWEWAKHDWWKTIPPDVRTTMVVLSSTLLIALVIGMLPWRSTAARNIRVLPMAWLILGVWLPSYAIYCVSFPASAPDEIVMHTLLNRDDVPASAVEHGQLARYAKTTLSEPPTLRQHWSNFKSWASDTTPGLGKQYAAMGEIDHWSWWKASLWLIALLVVMWAYPVWTRRGAVAWARGVAVGVAVIGLSWLVYLLADQLRKPVFMPRYVAVIWPMLAIATVVLISRVPTLALRMAAVALLVGLNVFQFSTRVWGETEPPSDLIARDVFDDRENIRIKTFLAGTWLNSGGAPAEGSFRSAPVQYYFWLLAKDPIRATEFQFMQYRRRMGLEHIEDLPIPQIRRQLRTNRELNRVIVWLESVAGRDPNDRTMLESMKTGWRQVSRQSFNAVDHWTWRGRYRLTRYEFERTPATRPTTNASAVRAD